MTQRIFCTVTRGMTDKTAVCVYPWELACLERIHGGDVRVVSIAEMSALGPAVRVEKQKMLHEGVVEGQTLKQQLERMAYVDPELDPAQDPEAEYHRLEERYGMDNEVKMSVVAMCYGPLGHGRFESEMRRMAEEKPHGELAVPRTRRREQVAA